MPKATDPVIETFTKEQLEAMLKACDRTGIWKSRELTSNARPTADRDRAIILLLADLVEQLPTIVTTNLPLSRLPQRIASRLQDRRAARVIAITTGDRRILRTGPMS